jgi:hypothetical protein
MELNISPVEVKTWSAEDVMETLAAIGMAERNSKKAANKGG